MLEAGMSGEGLEVFERLAVLMGNMTPLARLGAEALQRSTEESLATGVAPATGQAWAPLSASTLQRRAKEGRGGGYRTEALLRSLDVGCSADTAWIGSSLPQAATQQFGAQRGAFGRLSNGRPLPWGTIPARPFLGLSPESQSHLASDLLHHLLNTLTR